MEVEEMTQDDGLGAPRHNIPLIDVIHTIQDLNTSSINGNDSIRNVHLKQMFKREIDEFKEDNATINPDTFLYQAKHLLKTYSMAQLTMK